MSDVSAPADARLEDAGAGGPVLADWEREHEGRPDRLEVERLRRILIPGEVVAHVAQAHLGHSASSLLVLTDRRLVYVGLPDIWRERVVFYPLDAIIEARTQKVSLGFEKLRVRVAGRRRELVFTFGTVRPKEGAAQFREAILAAKRVSAA